jgi:hypothetical protein
MPFFLFHLIFANTADFLIVVITRNIEMGNVIKHKRRISWWFRMYVMPVFLGINNILNNTLTENHLPIYENNERHMHTLPQLPQSGKALQQCFSIGILYAWLLLSQCAALRQCSSTVTISSIVTWAKWGSR